MKILEEFKTFTLRGNMLELAVGFTVGAAFTTIAHQATPTPSLRGAKRRGNLIH